MAWTNEVRNDYFWVVADVKLRLQFYTHAVSRDRMAAAGKMLTAILSHATDQSGLKADCVRIARA